MDVENRIVPEGKKISVVSSGKMNEVKSVELDSGICVVVATSEVAGGEEMRTVSNAEVNSGNTKEVSAGCEEISDVLSNRGGVSVRVSSTGVGVKMLMEAVSSEVDIGRRRLTALDLEGVGLGGSMTAVVNPTNVSEKLTEVVTDERNEEIGKLGIGEASEVVGSGDSVSGVVKGITGGREVGMSTGVEKKKLGPGEASEVVGGGDGVSGVVKGIIGGREVGMSIGVEKKKL